VLPALALALRNITLICGILLTMRFPSLGIYGPTIGALGDGVLSFCILVPGLYRGGFQFQPRWQPQNAHLRKVVRLLIPNGLSASVNYAGTIVDTAFASMVNRHGELPALENAFRLIGLPIRLLGMAIAQATFPRLSAHAVAGEWQQMQRTLFWSLGAAMGMGVLVSLVMIGLGRPMIRIVLEGGQFDATAGNLTYTLLVGYAVALPAYIGTEILTRSLYALYDTLTPLLTNALQLTGRFLMIALLLDSMGIRVIPLAFALTSTVEVLLLGGVLFFKMRQRMKQDKSEYGDMDKDDAA
jgi:putative peptidoglycan lipid II flippase